MVMGFWVAMRPRVRCGARKVTGVLAYNAPNVCYTGAASNKPAYPMLNEVLIILILSVIGIAVFRRLDIPAVLGYLVVGLLAGDHAFGWIHDSHAIEQIAEIGVVFLLFTIGLEVSIPRLIAMRKIVFGIGVVQVIVSTLSTMAVGMLVVGLSWQVAFAVGGALTMSSTAIVTKLLTDNYELHLPHGNISLGCAAVSGSRGSAFPGADSDFCSPG